MKKYLLVILLVFIVPLIALASWWNPFSWKIFQKAKAPQIQTETQKISEEKINDLQEQINNLKTQKATTASITTKTKVGSVDKYGMTSVDWNREIVDITKVKETISLYEKYITQTEGYITNLDNSIKTVSGTMASQGLLDNTGIKYAQDYINQAQELELVYKQEINLSNSINDTLNKIIVATNNHDKNLMDQLAKTLTSHNEEFNSLTKQSDSLYMQEESALNTFYNYFKLLSKSYIQTPTYTPTYTPQTQQYNTNCSISSYYGGDGGTANCTTYSPSSSAISACAYIKSMFGIQSYTDKAYAKCIQDHSQKRF